MRGNFLAAGAVLLLCAACRAPLPPVRVFLAGDSLVAEYKATRPMRGWGQYLQDSFGRGVTVVNRAVPGESSGSCAQSGKWSALLAEHPDFVFIEFGHNDRPLPGNAAPADAATEFPRHLRAFIATARAARATPFLVTPIPPRDWTGEGELRDGLAPWAEAMLAVGRETGTPVLDLHRRGLELFRRLGPKRSAAFAPAPEDPVHLNEAGARTFAGILSAELRQHPGPLAVRLQPGPSATPPPP